MMVSIGYGYLFIYNSEIYPTKIRGLTMGLSLFIGRIFGAFTTYVMDIEESLHIHPLVFASLLCIIIIPFLPFMPETKNRGLKN